MKQQWHNASLKFSQLTTREQWLIILSGLAIVIILPFHFIIDGNLAAIKKQNINVTALMQENNHVTILINEFTQALAQDPNVALKAEIADYKKRLAEVDELLVSLTDELINPIQMRQALIKLLNMQKGVSLLSFEVLPVQPLMFNTQADKAVKANSGENKIGQIEITPKKIERGATKSLGLYRHGIKIKLKGKYFQLRDYLQQIENLPWKFYWHNFHYQLKQYPYSELEVEIYSLSTAQEFIGV